MSDCVSFPGQPAIPAVAAKTVTKKDFSWDAGADSVAQANGNCHLVFTMPVSVVGNVVGLKCGRQGVGLPDHVAYGIMFQKGLAGGDYYFVTEGGVAKTAQIARDGALDETFEIRRANGKVYYFLNYAAGVQPFYVSATPSNATLTATSCIYASGDSTG